jgi:hypothetical protein
VLVRHYPYFCLPKKEKSSSFNGNQAMKKRSIKSDAEYCEFIHSVRGSLKGKMGDKPFAQWWAEYKAEEKELEEARFQRLAALGKNKRA